MDKDTVRLNFEFPRSKYPYLKLVCAQKRLSLRDFATAILIKALDEENKDSCEVEEKLSHKQQQKKQAIEPKKSEAILSPGIYFTKDSFKIIPEKGILVEGAFDDDDLIYIYFEYEKQRRRILATTFIRVLGSYGNNDEIIETFFSLRRLKLNSEKDFIKFAGKILAQDSSEFFFRGRGEILPQEFNELSKKRENYKRIRAGEKLTNSMLKSMLQAGFKTILIAEDADETSPIIKMLNKDITETTGSAQNAIYSTFNLREWELRSLFMESEYYNLGENGRRKLNEKFGLEINILTNTTRLSVEDITGALKYLIRIKNGDPDVSID